MEKGLESVVYTACFMGAAICVSLAYEVGRNGKSKRYQEGFESGQRLSELQRASSSGLAAEDDAAPETEQ